MERAAEQFPPNAVEFAPDAYAAMKNADACLVLTEWEDFAALDIARMKQALRYPIVVDGRNLFKPAEMAAAGFNYYSIGRPEVISARPSVTQPKPEMKEDTQAA